MTAATTVPFWRKHGTCVLGNISKDRVADNGRWAAQ
jgi:hypothetical protein